LSRVFHLTNIYVARREKVAFRFAGAKGRTISRRGEIRGSRGLKVKNGKILILKDLIESPLTTFSYYTMSQCPFSTFFFIFLKNFLWEL